MVEWPKTFRETAPYILYPEHWHLLRKLKRSLIKQGFDHQISFWGYLKHVDKDEIKYMRVEIMCNFPPRRVQFELLRDMFTDFPTLKDYALFSFDVGTEDLKLIEAWDTP